MPMTIFDWIARTAMLAMAGLVTLSILGAIAAMGNDTGARFSAPGDRQAMEGEPVQEPANAQAPRIAEEGNFAASAPGQGQSGGAGDTIVAVRPAPEDKVARWLEAVTYALLALAGICALGVLMLWSILRELQRSRG